MEKCLIFTDAPQTSEHKIFSHIPNLGYSVSDEKCDFRITSKGAITSTGNGR
jgi:hypothetical protein